MDPISLAQNENERKLGFHFEFEIISDKNNTYSLILNSDTQSFLIIKATKKNDEFNKTYSNQFSVDKIKENKYFSMFDDLKDICNEISERINKKEVKLVENSKSLNFYLLIPVSKIKEINFELKEEGNNDIDQKNNLNELILKLKEEINEIKINYNKELNNIKINHSREINENKREIYELKNIIDNQYNEINEMREKIQYFTFYTDIKENGIWGLKDSFIINNNIEYNKIIKSWINPNANIDGELLYRLSRDGEQISKFHALCDNKGPTLTLFETIYGNKGGIFTPLSWDSKTEWKDDFDTFIFDLNIYKKFKKIKKDNSICCLKNHGPYTYNLGFYQKDQMRKIHHCGIKINKYYESGAEFLLNNNGNDNYFDIKEVEVYKIKI